MTYTRKNEPEHRTVTFNVSWIEEPLTIIAHDCLPLLAVTRTLTGDWSGVTSALPIDFVGVLESASGDEFTEFLDEWVKESKRTKIEEDKVDNLFSTIMGKEGFNFGG